MAEYLLRDDLPAIFGDHLLHDVQVLLEEAASHDAHRYLLPFDQPLASLASEKA